MTYDYETLLQLENDVTAFVDHYQDCMNTWRELLLKDSRSKAKAVKRKGPASAGRIKMGCKRAKRATRESDTNTPIHEGAPPLQVKSEDVIEEHFEVMQGRLRPIKSFLLMNNGACFDLSN